jgi:hypothetical protein
MAYLGKSPSQGVRNRYYFTASGGETSISGALTGGTLTFTDGNYVDVNLNGVTLVAGTDYNTSTANTIAGLSALTASDVVEIVVYDVFSVFSGNVNSDFSVGGNLSVTGTTAFTGATTITGLTTTGDINFGDNDKASFSSGKLQMYHDGTNAYIDETYANGTFLIRGNNISLQKYTGETMIQCVSDGKVELNFNNVPKFETTSSGVSVTGGFTATDGCTITTADNTVQLTLKSTDADANVGPIIDMIRDSSSPADGDELGRIRFKGDDDAGNDTTYAYLQVKINDAGDGSGGSEDGELEIFTRQNANGRSRMKFGFDSAQAETVFNEGSQDIDFRVESDNTTHALFVEGSSGNVGIGDSDPGRMLHIKALGTATAEQAALLMENEVGTTGEIKQGPASDNAMIFTENGSERMRVNTSGVLLIGKTADSIANNGISLAGSATGGGFLSVTNDGNSCVTLNRKTSDGTIMSFATDGSTGGSIGVLSDRLCVGQSDVGLFFDATNNTITPFSFDTFDTIDNHIDLGIGSRRFQDIFASNGTIQTSDENEKQNIASLTSTEITAAKAISALFKTYKWKDAAASKGDSARIHTGVIAQEVQTAMSDAGLDAANYAFWCSDTWWETSTDVPAVEAVDEVVDEYGNVITEAVEAKDAYTRIDTYHTADEAPDGATQRTRMGIRYPELLAFIGAATEQRLTDIETRLAALEAE